MHYYRLVHGVMVVYDLCSQSSLNSVRSWLRDVKKYGRPDMSRILVGNKADIAFPEQMHVGLSGDGISVGDYSRMVNDWRKSCKSLL